MPTLLPPAKPRFAPVRISSTPGKSRSTLASEPSVEPLSTQIVSIPASDASARGVSSPPFQLRTTATQPHLQRPRVGPGGAQPGRPPGGEHRRVERRARRPPPAPRRAPRAGRANATAASPPQTTAATTTPRSVRRERAERPEQRRQHGAGRDRHPAAIPARPNAARARPLDRHVHGERARRASSGSQRARPRTKSSGKATETATETTIHGAR